MSNHITLGQATRLLQDGFEKQAGVRPAINPTKVRVLVETGVLTDCNEDGSRPLLSRDEVLTLIENTIYLPSYDKLEDPVFRVSLAHLRENPVYSELDGRLMRTHSGYDYSNAEGLSDDELLGCWEGVWSISDANADYAVEHNAYLLATTKGYVAPGNVRHIIDWEPAQDSPRKYFHTEPLQEGDPLFQAKNIGYWVDVPAGRESNFDHDPFDTKDEDVDDLVEDNDLEETHPEEAEPSARDSDQVSLDDLIRLKMEQIKSLDELIELKKRQLDH